MKIASAEIKPFRRRLAVPLITTGKTITERSGYIIRLEADGGQTAYGEAGWNGPPAPDAKILNRLTDRLTGTTVPATLDDIHDTLQAVIPGADPGLAFGVETALCDLSAHLMHLPLCRWLHPAAREAVSVNLLFSGPPADWRQHAARIRELGYRAIKIKVGARTIEQDAAFIRQVRDTLGGDIALRLDANRAWTFEKACDALNEFSPFDIEYVEEPLSRFDLPDLVALRERTGMRIALDESLTDRKDLPAILAGGGCDLLILKPGVLGGFFEALQLVDIATVHECRVVVTSNLETEIGLAAILHFCASLPEDPPPCGLDTLRLFVDFDPGLSRVVNGAIAIPDGSGLGIDGDAIWERL